MHPHACEQMREKKTHLLCFHEAKLTQTCNGAFPGISAEKSLSSLLTSPFHYDSAFQKGHISKEINKARDGWDDTCKV